LTPLDILTATDAQLNEFVGLKKLGPYRSQDTKAKDKRKYGKKKRLREWRKKIAEEGEDEAVRAMLRMETQEAAHPAAEESEPKKKKRKSRKKGAVEV
jgi:protein KRI1